MRHFGCKGACTPKPSKGGLTLSSILRALSLSAREIGGEGGDRIRKILLPPVTSKEHPTREPEPEGQQLQRARSVQAGAGGPVAQGRAGKEGAGHRGESIKGVIQPVLSSEAPRARPGRLEKKVAPGRGETNCCNLCRSGSRFLIYSLPLFFFLLPKTSSSPPFFCFVFESRQLSGKGEKAFFLPFSFPRLFPSPSFPSSSLFLPTPGDLSRWPPGRGLSA